jgi:hypothetical protein
LESAPAYRRDRKQEARLRADIERHRELRERIKAELEASEVKAKNFYELLKNVENQRHWKRQHKHQEQEATAAKQIWEMDAEVRKQADRIRHQAAETSLRQEDESKLAQLRFKVSAEYEAKLSGLRAEKERLSSLLDEKHESPAIASLERLSSLIEKGKEPSH